MRLCWEGQRLDADGDYDGSPNCINCVHDPSKTVIVVSQTKTLTVMESWMTWMGTNLMQVNSPKTCECGSA